MKSKITVLPGDGIGVEVTREAVACLETIGKKFGHEFEFSEQLIGGVALDKTGVPLPDETLKSCLASDAVLLGAVGAPDRKSTRLNSSHQLISYAVFCLKKK